MHHPGGHGWPARAAGDYFGAAGGPALATPRDRDSKAANMMALLPSSSLAVSTPSSGGVEHWAAPDHHLAHSNPWCLRACIFEKADAGATAWWLILRRHLVC
jgi:hypothetical protein